MHRKKKSQQNVAEQILCYQYKWNNVQQIFYELEEESCSILIVTTVFQSHESRIRLCNHHEMKWNEIHSVLLVLNGHL